MNFLEELNSEQQDAARHIDGPMMVIAGAGSGKTRVLTYRIAHLMKNGIDPFNILALTFTNKAAAEMKERIGSLVGFGEAKNIAMGTFHSVFAKILRFNADKIGYSSNFTIYDTQDSKSLIKTIIKELNLDDKIYKPGNVYARISGAKNNLISPKAYESNSEIIAEDRMARRPLLFEIYAKYNNRCFKSSAMDFDDLLFKTNELLRDFPDVLHFYQQKFKYILVDEYQDTNYAQYLIVKKLAAVNENICVVGDDAQSIYSFRGANIENILNFRKDYPDYKLYKLEQNYRSTKNIVEAANSIIAKNIDQIKKVVWTANSVGNQIRIIRCNSDNDEGRIITNRIFDVKHQLGIEYKDFAILYRTNAQSRSFEESLRKLNMPYKIYGGISFYQRKEIKDLIAYFRLAVNPRDEEALKRIINYPKRGIGNTTIEALTLASLNYNVSIWDLITNPKDYPVKLNVGSQTKIMNFATKIMGYASKMEKIPAYELASEIATSTGILRELHEDKTPEGISRYENIQELLAGIKEFSISQQENQIVTLADFLTDVALLTDADQETEEDKNKITLMTVHAAKGLEFQHVYVVGMEENLFPSQLSLSSRHELEEERRLFYVAVTRAQIECTISYVTTRFKWGQYITSEPSRFIDEIDDKYLNFENSNSTSTKGFSLRSNRSFSMPSSQNKTSGNLKNRTEIKNSTNHTTNIPELSIGNTVEHNRFGRGKVTGIEGKFPDQKATVYFQTVGQKVLILKFAKLKVIE